MTLKRIPLISIPFSEENISRICSNIKVIYDKISEIIQKIISDYKEAQEEYAPHRKRCQRIGITKEHLKRVERLQRLFFYKKIYW